MGQAKSRKQSSPSDAVHHDGRGGGVGGTMKYTWVTKEIVLSLGNDRVQTGTRRQMAATCGGLAVHPDRWGCVFEVTHIKTGRNFGCLFDHKRRADAKRTAEKLLPLTNWETLDLRRWKANKTLRKKVLALAPSSRRVG